MMTCTGYLRANGDFQDVVMTNLLRAGCLQVKVSSIRIRILMDISYVYWRCTFSVLFRLDLFESVTDYRKRVGEL